MKLYCL